MTKILFSILLFLTSCGFHELQRNDTIQNVIVIPSKKDESMFVARKILEAKFKYNGNPEYKLFITKAESSSASGLGSDSSTSNFTLSITLDFRLTKVNTNEIIFVGSVNGTTNYLSGDQNTISEHLSKKSASKNLSRILADEVYDKIQNQFGF